MTKNPSKASRQVAGLPLDYAPLLAEIKARVQVARVKAGLAANRELLLLYWDIGRMIHEAQRTRGYGKQVVGRLARDIQRAFPGISGFSERNVWLMRAFYAQWEGEAETLQRPVAESAPERQSRSTAKVRKLQRPVAHLTRVPSLRKLSPAVTVFGRVHCVCVAGARARQGAEGL